MVIHKFEVFPGYNYVSSDLEFIKPLTVQVQNNNIYLWALMGARIDPIESNIEVTLYATGERNVEGQYIGTVQQKEFVWHCFLL